MAYLCKPDHGAPPQEAQLQFSSQLSSLNLRIRVTLLSSRSILFLGNCFKGHSGFQVKSSGLEAIDFPVTFLAACKSAERGGRGGAARAGEPKLPQGHITEPRHTISGLQAGCRSAVVTGEFLPISPSVLKHPIKILPQHSLCTDLLFKSEL